ncbi:MAG: efflux RND transporter permease subunit [Candidatus Udaeobacter sp.]
MSRFSLRFPYFIIVACLMVCVVGITSLTRMPVDLFPSIKIPVVVVATFFSGMPPEQIETDITGRFERFFTLGSGIDHIESRSLPGVSLIKIYFQPGTNADSAVTTISNLAMADLRRLPPGTLPPVVLKFDASSLPVCLITLKGEGMNETQLRDLGQFAVRNQVANVPGASVPQPFGGRYRQIMVYVDPLKLEAHQLSVMDVVRTVNESNLILPAGDVKIGPFDYNLYTNSQLNTVDQINSLPLKTVGDSSVLVGDVGYAADAAQIQTSIVRVDGQRSVYLPVLKQGGDVNTISVVDGIKSAIAGLVDVPKSLVAKVVFDQSIFVKTAIDNLLHEGAIGLVLTGLMILVFLGSFRATVAVFLSIPLSALATFIGLSFGDNSVNAMILGGLALAFSRLIDNSVVVLENIFRHLEHGEVPAVAAEKGGREVALPVLAATLATAVVFFPVIFLYGVSRFLFTALALSVVLSLFASYVVAMTVVPLFCAKLIRTNTPNESVARPVETEKSSNASLMQRFNHWFNDRFHSFLNRFDAVQAKTLARPVTTVLVILGVFLFSMCLAPALGVAYFPRTDPGQFVINLKAATGTRLETTEREVKKVEDIVRKTVTPHDLRLIASNIGATPGFSSIYTSNSASHTAFVQVSLTDDHKIGSYEYMNRVRKALRDEAPELTSYFQSGGLVDAVLNLGLPAPLDIQVSGSNLESAYATASEIAGRVRALSGVDDVLIPQDIDAPAYNLAIDREHASELGLTEKEVVSNVITALTSNQMIAPSYWVDPRTGNDYFLTVQYPENAVKSLNDLRAIPLRAGNEKDPTRLDAVTKLVPIQAPTEVDHYQLQRVIDIYVSPRTEELGSVAANVDRIIATTSKPEGVRVAVRGSVQAMRSSFASFGLGLLLAVVLVYLILVAQFKSFIDPLLILLAVPPGLSGVLLILVLTGTTLNIMSLMGVVMMAGIVVSNSILIVEFTHRLLEDGIPLQEAIQTATRVRLRPILMTSLATIFGLIPMALKLGTGSEAYAPLARAIIGGLLSSLLLTIFIVPAAFYLVYRKRIERPDGAQPNRPIRHAFPAVSTGLAMLIVTISFSASRAEAQPEHVDHLDLPTAETLALRHAPAIAREYFRTQAAKEVVKQVRAGLFPQLTGSVAAVATGDDISNVFGGSPITNVNPESRPVSTRLGAVGGLNNPTVLTRESNGVNLTQLLTDFGHTANLIAASNFSALSQAQQIDLVRTQVLLLVDESYFRVLEAEALSRVAKETVATRQVIVDQINALVQAQLRSDLDASFAQVNLEQANLLLLDAQTRLQSAFADLSAALGYQQPHRFVLADATVPDVRDQTLSGLLGEAFRTRPDIIALRDDISAASKVAVAEQRARLPRVNLLGSFGRTPTGDPQVRETYAAAGFDVELPLMTGGRLSARAREMQLRVDVARKALDDLEDQVTREVNIGWLDVAQAKNKIPVTDSLLNAASQAFDLAQSRYEIGVASFVELSQAELARTQAAIDEATAKYEYEISKAVLQFDTGSLRFVKPKPNLR